jgi:hypothetical protein
LFEKDGTVGVSSFPEIDSGSPGKLYKYIDGKNVRKEILLKNSKIVLEKSVKWNEYVQKNNREKTVLEKWKNKRFFDEINNFELVTRDILDVFCSEICIYDQGILIASFRTNGRLFYDKKNKIMYCSRATENLLEKYWGVLEENHCR